MSEKIYGILKTKPVARFFYRGTKHSHPVRRTILVIATNKRVITGYEIREGDIVRDATEAPIKSYRQDRIPNWDDYWRLRRYNRQGSTLKRCTLKNLAKHGA